MQYLIPVISVTGEAEIKRDGIQEQLKQNVSEIPSQQISRPWW
jgi:hypothetical protein